MNVSGGERVEQGCRRGWKDAVVINEQRGAGSFVPQLPAQISLLWNVTALAWIKCNGDVWKAAFVTAVFVSVRAFIHRTKTVCVIDVCGSDTGFKTSAFRPSCQHCQCFRVCFQLLLFVILTTVIFCFSKPSTDRWTTETRWTSAVWRYSAHIHELLYYVSAITLEILNSWSLHLIPVVIFSFSLGTLLFAQVGS